MPKGRLLFQTFDPAAKGLLSNPEHPGGDALIPIGPFHSLQDQILCHLFYCGESFGKGDERFHRRSLMEVLIDNNRLTLKNPLLEDIQ